VKGALMQAARYIPEAPPGSAGVGELNALRAANLNRAPNPNLALNRFVVPDPTGGKTPVFNAVSWSDAAKANASWDAVSWSDASWSDVLAAADVTWEDAAESETGSPTAPDTLTPEEEAAALADPLLGLEPVPAPPPPAGNPLPSLP
jgi:hypothetical protein